MHARHSADTRQPAGILLLCVIAIDYGGTHVLSLVRGRTPATPRQRG